MQAYRIVRTILDGPDVLDDEQAWGDFCDLLLEAVADSSYEQGYARNLCETFPTIFEFIPSE